MNLDKIMQELRVEYIEGLPSKVEEIQAHLENKDLEALKNDFHKLKGSGKTYGLPEVSILGKKVEHMCESSPDEVAKYIPKATQVLELIHRSRLQGQAYDIEACEIYSQLKSL